MPNDYERAEMRRQHIALLGTDRMVDLIDRLVRFGFARNRDVDHETREVTITDDEAVLILDALVKGPL